MLPDPGIGRWFSEVYQVKTGNALAAIDQGNAAIWLPGDKTQVFIGCIGNPQFLTRSLQILRKLLGDFRLRSRQHQHPEILLRQGFTPHVDHELTLQRTAANQYRVTVMFAVGQRDGGIYPAAGQYQRQMGFVARLRLSERVLTGNASS